MKESTYKIMIPLPKNCIFLFCLCLLGCSSFEAEYKKEAFAGAEKKIIYSTCFDAVVSGDFESASDSACSDEDRRAALIMKQISIGKFEEIKENAFDFLETAAKNYYIKSLKEIIECRYLTSHEWKSYISFSEKNDSADYFLPFIEKIINTKAEILRDYSSGDTLDIEVYSGVVIVTCFINGKECEFVLDTGCPFSYVTDKIVRPVKDSIQIPFTSSVDKSINTSPILLSEAKLGKTALRNFPFYIIPEDYLDWRSFIIFGKKIDGIIGWDFIEKNRIIIDYPNEKLIIEKPIINDKTGINKNFIWLDKPLIISESALGKHIFFLDTGASCSELYEHILFTVPNELNETSSTSVGTLSGKSKREFSLHQGTDLYIDSVKINVRNVPLFERSSGFLDIDGLIGGDILNNCKVLIDAQNNIFRVEI